MQALDHPNVLKLTGVCLDGGPAPYIIMPFMANGSLLNYLKENRESLVVDLSSDDVVNFGGEEGALSFALNLKSELILFRPHFYLKLIE